MREELFRFRFCAGGGENPSFSPPPPHPDLPNPGSRPLTGAGRSREAARRLSREAAEEEEEEEPSAAVAARPSLGCTSALARKRLSSAHARKRRRALASGRLPPRKSREIRNTHLPFHPSGNLARFPPSPPHPSAAAQIPPFLVAAALFLTSFYYSNKYKSRGGSPPSGPAYKT